jgi:NADH-quinone oxidoreductase subunit F
MALCAYATGAEKGYLYLIEDMEEPIAAAEAAIAELRAAGWLGPRIAGSDFSFDVDVHRGPRTYVAGEETAALEAIEGRVAKPRAKPPYPGERGLFGQPTTVNNVETLAHVPFVVREGAAAYRAIGTEGSPGTMLFTLGERVVRPGVYELPFGATFRDLLYGCGGGPRSGRPLRAVLPALSCAFLSAEHLDARMDHATLRALGSSLGCGGVTFVEVGEDPLARVAEIAAFFMAEQCGLCPPCRMETNQIAHLVAQVRAGEAPGYAAKLSKLTAFARGKGRCSLIEMAAAPVLSALTVFAEDFARAAGGSGG